ncbi:hypothetical protein [Nostoc sp.]
MSATSTLVCETLHFDLAINSTAISANFQIIVIIAGLDDFYEEIYRAPINN